jgi:hypothetical protein
MRENGPFGGRQWGLPWAWTTLSTADQPTLSTKPTASTENSGSAVKQTGQRSPSKTRAFSSTTQSDHLSRPEPPRLRHLLDFLETADFVSQ